MKIVFVNGSPKGNNCISQKIIDRLIPYCKGHQYGILSVNEDMDRNMALQIMNMADGIVIVSPVYAGGIPSVLLGFLSDLEMHMSEKKARVSAIVHGDLFDSDDCLNALSIVEAWTSHTGLAFCNGLGIGGSDQFMVSDAGFDNRHLKEGMADIMRSIIQGVSLASRCVSPGNRMLYRRNMETLHHAKMEENGVEPDTWNVRIARLFRSSSAVKKDAENENVSESDDQKF